MLHQYSAVFERGEKHFVGYCPEVPGANGQGETLEECREDLKEAIKLILEHLREEGMRGVPEDAIRETIEVA